MSLDVGVRVLYPPGLLSRGRSTWKVKRSQPDVDTSPVWLIQDWSQWVSVEPAPFCCQPRVIGFSRTDDK